MIRIVFFIVVFAVFLAFIALNLTNKSDISFGFVSFEDVPVFLSTLFSFALGMMFALPLILFGKGRKKPAAAQGEEKKKRWGFGKKISKNDEVPGPTSISEIADEIRKENGPYGID